MLRLLSLAALALLFGALPTFAQTPASASALSPEENALHRAAAAGDTLAVWRLMMQQVPITSYNSVGETALHTAVRNRHFETARVMLQAYPSVKVRDRNGVTVLQLCERLHGYNDLPLLILLRAYAFLHDVREKVPPPPEHPSRVLILENTVNYYHSRIEPYYAFNEAERDGEDNVDDDGNGYVDDVYGWDPYREEPYRINPLQADVYAKNREVIGRLLKIEEDLAAGRISSFEADRRLAGFTNPLAQIMGPHPDLSDGKFLNLLKSEAHGSHVAGIALREGQGKADILAVKVMGVRNPALMFEERTEPVVMGLIAAHDTLEGYLNAAYDAYLRERVALGQRYADYIKATGAGVANLSFGSNFNYAEKMVITLAKFYVNMRGPVPLPEAEIARILFESSFDFYLADAAAWAMVFDANPHTLFICAAGNENEDNDETFGSPGYLSRILPNVITVAAVNRDNQITNFSDYGRKSVQIAALGKSVKSTVIEEADLYMDGTSMAAPAVAGTAALLRALLPDAAVWEIRDLLLFSSRHIPGLRDYVVTSGVADPSIIISALQGSSQDKLNAFLYLAERAASMPFDEMPESVQVAREYAQLALNMSPDNAKAKAILANLP